MNYDERYNAKIKVYPDGNFKATYCNKCIFPAPKIEDEDFEIKPLKRYKSKVGVYQDWDISFTNWCIYPHGLKKDTSENDDKSKREVSVPKEKSAINIERAMKRAKERIFDLAYINDFKYFVTITFDIQKVNSSNAKEVISKLRVWLSNQKQRFNMEYILVPEYHKVGDRIHCHLLITEYPMSLLKHAQKHGKGGKLKYNKDGSPVLMYTSKGQPIYNMLSWQYGYSTCIPIYKAVNESNIKLAHYITKYMTKDVHKIFGKFFWSSKGLKRVVDTEVFNTDYYSLELKEYEIPNTNIRLKYDSQFEYIIGGKSKNDG